LNLEIVRCGDTFLELSWEMPQGTVITHTSAYVSIRQHTSAYVSIR
jgi:hypothetical protein